MLVFVVIVVAFSAQVDSCGAWPAGKWWSRNATFTTPGGTWTLIFDNSRQDTFTYLEANFTSCDPTVLGVETRIGTQLQRRLAVRVTQERLTAELINGDAEPVPNFNEQYRFIVHDSTTYDACTQERTLQLKWGLSSPHPLKVTMYTPRGNKYRIEFTNAFKYQVNRLYFHGTPGEHDFQLKVYI